MRLICVSLLALATWMPSAHGQDEPVDSNSDRKMVILSQQLENARAETVVPVLNELFDVKFTSEESTNMVYARVSEDQVEQISEIIDQMEARAAKVEQERKKRLNVSGRIGSRGGLGGGFGRAIGSSSGAQASRSRLGKEAGSARDRNDESNQPDSKPSSIIALEAIAPAIAKDLKLDFSWMDRELAPLVKELAKIRPNLGPDHPQVKSLEEQIQTAKGMLLEALNEARRERMAARPSSKFANRHAAIETEVSKFIDKLRGEEAKDLPAEEVDEIEANLTESVGKLFDVRQQAEEADWEKFNEQLKKIRQRLDERSKNRDEIVARRVEELLKNEPTEL